MHYTHITKKHNQENFPVASLLLPDALRRDLLAFYTFARGADDIADDPMLTDKQKQIYLGSINSALHSGNEQSLVPWARDYLHLIKSGKLSVQYGQELLSAFIQDTHQKEYHDLEELNSYCRRSAVPVGRAMLDLASESGADIAAADALCIVLQLLNHMQDIRKDYLVLNRMYLPRDWLSQAGADTKVLFTQRLDHAWRKVLDRMLEYCHTLILQSRHLPATINNRRLRIEMRLIWQAARQLQRKLCCEDPLAKRVKLSFRDKSYAFFLALKQEYI